MTPSLLHSIKTAARLLGIGRSTLYLLIAEGEIHPVKIKRRRLIPDSEIRRYVKSLEGGPHGQI
ncbi:MAG: helix-turn-helix domain-containing protein [Planctomycetota bacterium]|jgi:excisionase family DNA binding protein|nr:helix-turn-helix domain-containing protein [Alphaproteobacteria bacterium]MDP6850917.1 helix-turn-helix domain-containing protein [Planctomycetota bacterium]